MAPRLAEGRSGGGDADSWTRAVIHGAAVACAILSLYVYWFAFADRYRVFLYFHPMGPRVPDTSPFSPVTSSRYWMAGLVASGAVLLGYSVVSWATGRVRDAAPPAWWRVWVVSAAALVVGIPVIVVSGGAPSLPAVEAAKTTLAALAGTGLACAAAQLAAERPDRYLWLALDGIGVMLVLLSGSLLFWPLMAAGVAQEPAVRLLPFAGMAAAILWLVVTTALQYRLRMPVPSAVAIWSAGSAWAYLVLPLAHHIAFTDGYFYITNSSNFFYGPWWVTMGSWAMAAALSAVAWDVRRRIARAY